MSKQSGDTVNEDGLVLCGYHKKLKTMKKKYFVLYKETRLNSARLEYFDNEKKFKSGVVPKRTIKLKNCFNINRRLDTKYDFVVALSTRDGTFGIVLETEEEMTKWLEELITLQRSETNTSESNLPHFEHVWQVTVQRRGLAEFKGILGIYYVCLSPKSLTFIRIGPEKTTSGEFRILNIEFLLTTIRRCGESQSIFYIEVGRQSLIGPGELWMETEDVLIAQNMHQMILNAMSVIGDTYFEPMRQRSSSANEASKPINMLQRKHTQPDKTNASPQTVLSFPGRERSDSLPSRNRSSSESANQSFTAQAALIIRNNTLSGHRSFSHQRYSNSPPIGCSESEESSMSIDEPDDTGSFLSYRFNSRSSEGVIPEENTDELSNNDSKEKHFLTDTDQIYHTLNTAERNEKNYLSMTPIRVFSENLNANSKKREETQIKYNFETSSLEFPEYISEGSRNSLNESETQSDRPIRTYSVGSKSDHNKLKNRFGNDIDHISTRVRAFSVGSRAKIPRCDLQHSIIYPKSMIEKNFSTNNNTYSVNDINLCNQLMNINVCRGKKSTSAPLLNYRCPASVDKMSDLMEIDFSKASSNSNYQTNMKIPLPKNFSNKNQDTVANNLDERLCQSPITSLTIKSISKTDNGYLEMKPVGNLLNRCALGSFATQLDNTSTSEEIAENKLRTDNFHLTQGSSSKLIKLNENNDVSSNKNVSSLQTSMKCIENTDSLQKTDIEKENSLFTEKLSNSELLLPKTKNCPKLYKVTNFALNLNTKQESVRNYINIDTISCNKDLTSNLHKCNVNTNVKNNLKNNENQNYKSRIKDDISSHDLTKNESILKNRNEANEYFHTDIKNKLTNNSSFTSLTSLQPLCNFLSASTSSLNYFPAGQNKNTSSTQQDEVQCCNISNCKNLSKTNCRPSSITLGHELHYASLDLPEQKKVIVKCKAEAFGDTLPVAAVNNSYAKIDFDHSDSSSSSSRNYNT